MTSDTNLIDFANAVYADAEARGLEPPEALWMLGCVITSIIRGIYPEPRQLAVATTVANHLVSQFPDHATRH